MATLSKRQEQGVLSKVQKASKDSRKGQQGYGGGTEGMNQEQLFIILWVAGFGTLLFFLIRKLSKLYHEKKKAEKAFDDAMDKFYESEGRE